MYLVLSKRCFQIMGIHHSFLQVCSREGISPGDIHARLRREIHSGIVDRVHDARMSSEMRRTRVIIFLHSSAQLFRKDWTALMDFGWPFKSLQLFGA